MKNSNHYNRFIRFGNAPVCVYGNKTISLSTGRKRKSIMRLINWMFNKSSGLKTRAG